MRHQIFVYMMKNFYSTGVKKVEFGLASMTSQSAGPNWYTIRSQNPEGNFLNVEQSMTFRGA